VYKSGLSLLTSGLALFSVGLLFPCWASFFTRRVVLLVLLARSCVCRGRFEVTVLFACTNFGTVPKEDDSWDLILIGTACGIALAPSDFLYLSPNFAAILSPTTLLFRQELNECKSGFLACTNFGLAPFGGDCWGLVFTTLAPGVTLASLALLQISVLHTLFRP